MTKTTKRLTLLLFALLVLLVPAGSASAASWTLSFNGDLNTYVAPGDEVAYFISARNVGSTSTGAGPENAPHVTVQLPPGVTATVADGNFSGFELWECEGIGTSRVSCVYPLTEVGPGEAAFAPIRISGVLDANAAPGVLPPATAEIAGGGGEGDANIPTLVDGTTPCGYSNSTIPYQPPCATAGSKEIQISSSPHFGINAFDGRASANQQDDPFTQAGGHPFSIATDIAFNTYTHPQSGPSWPVEPVKDILVDLPPGFAGYPIGTDRCKLEDLAPNPPQSNPLCSPESQVGVSDNVFSYGNGTTAPPVGEVPIYNLVPPPGVPARFGMRLFGVIVTFDFTLRSGTDYGLSVNVRNVSEGLALIRSKVSIWGFPAAPVHDPQRRCAGTDEPGCTSSADPEKPFLRLPTSCTGPLATSAHADSWFNPGALDTDGAPSLADPNWISKTFVSHDPPGFPLPESEWGPQQGVSGCDQVPFDADVSVDTTSHEADSPTGLSFDLSIPQEDVGGIAPSDLKKAVVTLPAGMSVNPSSADGLASCRPDQVKLKSAADASCPAASKVGTVRIDTPLLEAPLQGSVYLASQGDNPFGSLLAIYLVAKGPGLNVKLAGHVEPTADGRLVTTFDNQPQDPFSQLHLELKGGPRGVLLTPAACGSYSVDAALSPWARPGEALQRTDSFQITSGPGGTPCATGLGNRPFQPGFSAGVDNIVGGSQSPFRLNVSRGDGNQELSGLSFDTPPGLSAYLRGVPYCPQSALDAAAAKSGAQEQAAPSCPAASRIGSVTASAGAGPNPFSVKGTAYLAGPYKGAPLSAAIVTPALAGPFDLGTVVIRAALHVDPSDAHLHAVSDPIPQSLQNIALHLRSFSVDVDRPNFMLAPTNCDAMSVSGRIGGSSGALADVSNRFQLADCASLGFKPQLTLSLKGGTKRTKHPVLRSVVTYPSKGAYANIASAAVTLPRAEIIDPNHIGNPCTRPQFAEEACPKISILGRAKAWSPLLEKPLEGPVIFRANGGERALPDVVADLRGQIHVVLVGAVDTVTPKTNPRIRTTFFQVPDAPVSKFELNLFGGKRGLLINSANLCKAPDRAVVRLTAQNGKTHDSEPVVANSCGKKKSKQRRH